MIYEKEVVEKPGLTAIGIDLGRNKAITRSDGATSERLDDLLTKISRKRRGSNAYRRAKAELKHAVNHAAKTAIDWKSIAVLRMEKLTGMKSGRRWGNKSHHWRVGLLQKRILSWADEHGVRVDQVNPAWTSQTCSGCGHCEPKNRSGERFRCLRCDLTLDADVNAACNVDQKGAHVSLLRNNDIRACAPALTG